MKQVNIGQYFQKINDVITNTEEMGSKMNPYYEELRTAIDENKEVTTETLAKVYTIFEEGTEVYHQYQANVEKMAAPVKLMGLHKKFVKAYVEYVAACDDMLASVNPDEGLNVEQFNASEKAQDEASQKVSAAVSRMATMLMR